MYSRRIRCISLPYPISVFLVALEVLPILFAQRGRWKRLTKSLSNYSKRAIHVTKQSPTPINQMPQTGGDAVDLRHTDYLELRFIRRIVRQKAGARTLSIPTILTMAGEALSFVSQRFPNCLTQSGNGRRA